MPTLPIPILKGVLKSVDATSVQTPEYAIDLKNLFIDAAGVNRDRPGLAATPFGITGSAFGIEGMFYFKVSNTVVLVDTNRRIWSLTEAGVTSEIGYATLAGSSRPVFDSDGTYLAIAGGGAPQQWSGTGPTALLAGSPEPSTHILHIDGYWINFLTDDQELRFAGPTAVARQTFNSSDFFSAEYDFDNVVAVKKLFRELYAFGTKSFEKFANVGTDQPWVRTFGVDIGCGAPYSVVQADNTLWWLDNKRRIVRLEGSTPIQVSEQIGKVLYDYETVSDCWSSEVLIGDYKFLIFVFPTAETSWAYDYRRQEWYEWNGFANSNESRLPIHSHLFVEEWKKHLVGDPFTGVVRELTFDAKVDGDNPFRRTRRMRYNHGTLKKKFSEGYTVKFKRGVGTPGGDEPVFEMRVNDDNKGWSNPRQVPMGFPGEKQKAVKVSGLRGVYTERQLEITMTEPYEFQLQGIEEDVQVEG